MGRLIEIANASGFGKSVLAANIYVQLAKAGYNVEFIQESVKKKAYSKYHCYLDSESPAQCWCIDTFVLKEAVEQNEFVVYDNCGVSPLVYDNMPIRVVAKYYKQFEDVLTLSIQTRQFPFKPQGRFENLEKSDALDVKFGEALELMERPYLLVKDLTLPVPLEAWILHS